MKLLRGLEHLPSEYRLIKLELFSVEGKKVAWRPQRNLPVSGKGLQGSQRETLPQEL